MNKVKRWLLIIISSAIICSIIIFFYNNKAAARENNIKKAVLIFNNKSIRSIKILNNDNQNYELSDSDFLYTLDKNYKIKRIERKDLHGVKVGNKVPLKKAEQIGKNFLNKASFKLGNYAVEKKEANLKNNTGYTLFYECKTDDNINTGNFAYVDLFSDGSLKGLQVHTENNTIYKTTSKISKNEAKTIVFNYLNTNEILKKYIPYIRNNYKLESNVFHGIKIWRFATKIPDSEYYDFEFSYLIDSNTGDFLLKSEPKMPGFSYDPVVEKRFYNLIDKK